jgi:hypothetical protein
MGVALPGSRSRGRWFEMLTDEQVAMAAAETMVGDAAIRAAALTLCVPRDALTPADVIAVTIRLLLEHPPRAAATHRSQPSALVWR